MSMPNWTKARRRKKPRNQAIDELFVGIVLYFVLRLVSTDVCLVSFE